MNHTAVRARAFRTLIRTRRTYVPQGDESLKEAGDKIVSAEVIHSGPERHLLTLGGELRREELDVPGFNAGTGGAQTARHAAVFGQDDFALTDDLSLVAGCRYDDHRFFGAEISPRIYSVWDLCTGVQIKGGYGHGFKAPSLKQIHPDYFYDIASMTIIGNPDLVPETTESFELGGTWRARRGFLGATLFTNSIDNLIDNLTISNDPKRIVQPMNITTARTRGMETEFGLYLGHGFDLGGNWTHLDARDLTLDLPLPNRPRNTVNVSLDWTDPLHGWDAGVRFEYRSSQWIDDGGEPTRVGGFGLWNLAVGKSFGELISLSLNVQNIGDRQLDTISPLFNYYQRGRFFTLGVLYRFR